MKKCMFIRKIYDDGKVDDKVFGYIYKYNGIKYGVYNCKDYTCQYDRGFMPVLICDNEKYNGLSLTTYKEHYNTLKETREKVHKVIDEKKDYILKIIGE